MKKPITLLWCHQSAPRRWHRSPRHNPTLIPFPDSSICGRRREAQGQALLPIDSYPAEKIETDKCQGNERQLSDTISLIRGENISPIHSRPLE